MNQEFIFYEYNLIYFNKKIIMSNYNKVLNIAEDLRAEYKELTIHHSLEIATKIQQCDVLSDGLLVQGSSPVALETRLQSR